MLAALLSTVLSSTTCISPGSTRTCPTERSDEQATKPSDKTKKVNDQKIFFTKASKLNLNISEEERKIDTAYEQIGKWYVEKHREDAEEDVKTWLDAIAVSEARIKECRESIHQMKGVAICPSCGASVDADAAFCSACGQKMPEKPKPEPVKEEDVEVIPPEQPSEEPASETVSENASETQTEAPASDASTEA